MNALSLPNYSYSLYLLAGTYTIAQLCRSLRKRSERLPRPAGDGRATRTGPCVTPRVTCKDGGGETKWKIRFGQANEVAERSGQARCSSPEFDPPHMKSFNPSSLHDVLVVWASSKASTSPPHHAWRKPRAGSPPARALRAPRAPAPDSEATSVRSFRDTWQNLSSPGPQFTTD